MPLQATSGAASYDAFGGGVAAVPQYIEDVFSTFLLSGTGGSYTVNNGIDLSTKGGMTWLKRRDATGNNQLFDTNRGAVNALSSNLTNAQFGTTVLDSFTTTGFTGSFLASGSTHASWTFRKQPKFFDVVTYTGNGAGPQVINHNLGSAPGCVIVKSTTNTSVWWVWHRGNGGSTDLTGIELNATSAASAPNAGVASDFTATTFNAGSLINVALNLNPNVNGQTYVAYLFAHNAGGFGLTGTDNVISCGSYTGNGSTSGPTITLGYEPQWILVKNASGANPWNMDDNMRGWEAGGLVQNLQANASYAESQQGPALALNSTGFKVVSNDSDWNGTSATYIYIAIRRGPMKVPTSGTSVFSPITYTGNATDGRAITTGFVPDTVWWKSRSNATNWRDATLLIGTNTTLSQNLTAAEENVPGYYIKSYQNTGFTYDAWDSSYNQSGYTYVVDAFQRAPSFHDVVCCAAPGYAITNQPHNLGVTPELFISKPRTNAGAWYVYGSVLGTTYQYLVLNDTGALQTSGAEQWGATSTTFSEPSTSSQNNYVTYLFASCPGVSKVGSYTGTGTTKQVDCGFTSGARFVLIKKTSGTGSWYVWDSARGIVSGNDPYLLLNSTAAEVTSTDYIDTYSAGFEISSTAPSEINENGGSFIFLAIS